MLRVRYTLTAPAADAAAARAAALVREQTVELPAGIVPAAIERPVLGEVLAVAAAGAAGSFDVDVAYPEAVVGDDLLQLLNVLLGNASMWDGVRVAGIDWPADLLACFAGPAHGIAGLRALCGVARRPLLCAALKPVGLDAGALADLAARLADAGVDLVKDDHGVADQPAAPWDERVPRVAEAVARAAAAAGTGTVYAPNLTGPVDRLPARVERLRALGVRAALVAPVLLGFDTVRVLAATSGLALLGHPALSGVFLGAAHGIAPEVLWGDLFRVAGCDAVIYPNAGGRFPIDLATCERVAHRLRAPLGALRPAAPALGGGIEPARMPEWVARYGRDTVFLVGAGIARERDPRAAARRILDRLAEDG